MPLASFCSTCFSSYEFILPFFFSCIIPPPLPFCIMPVNLHSLYYCYSAVTDCLPVVHWEQVEDFTNQIWHRNNCKDGKGKHCSECTCPSLIPFLCKHTNWSRIYVTLWWNTGVRHPMRLSLFIKSGGHVSVKGSFTEQSGPCCLPCWEAALYNDKYKDTCLNNRHSKHSAGSVSHHSL